MNILLLSWHYNDGSSEGLCTARVANALRLRGHRVTVLTRDAGGEASDRAAGEQSQQEPGDEIEIIRINAEMAKFRLWNWWNENQGRSLLHRVVSAALNLRHFASAQQWAWVVAAGRRGTELARARSGTDGAFDVVFSRLNPQVSHQAAQRLVDRFPTLAWCAYFSDPWPHFLYPKPFPYRAGRWSQRRGLAVLRAFYRRADALLFPSRRLAAYMTEPERIGATDALPDQDAIFVVPHAAPETVEATTTEDPTESPVNGSSQVDDRPRLRIRHAGFLMGERKVDALLAAITLLPAEARADLHIEFVGRVGAQGPPSLRGIEDTVSFYPAVSPDRAFEWMTGATVSLLVETDVAEGIFMPSKLAEYAALGHPILALSPAVGTVADYLADGGGLRADPSDPEQIAAALAELHRQWTLGALSRLAPDRALRECFRQETIGAQVEEALRYAISKASPDAKASRP